jgi:hypothetical protein
MKKYSKPKVIAKNLPSGSYAAGCPVKDEGGRCLMFYGEKGCKYCERTK